MTESETQPVLRRAIDADAPSITELVADAYRHYEPLIGRTPMPMLIHYEEALRAHDIWVLEANGTLVGIIELEARPDHLWIENVASVSPTSMVRPRTPARLIPNRSGDAAASTGM